MSFFFESLIPDSQTNFIASVHCINLMSFFCSMKINDVVCLVIIEINWYCIWVSVITDYRKRCPLLLLHHLFTFFIFWPNTILIFLLRLFTNFLFKTKNDTVSYIISDTVSFVNIFIANFL